MSYRLGAVYFELICRWVEVFTLGANDINGLLRNLVVDMLVDFLELGHWTKKVPGLELN